MSQVRPYIMDLGSTNGTYLNNERLDPERYYELLNKVLKPCMLPCNKYAKIVTDCSMSILCHANWHYPHGRCGLKHQTGSAACRMRNQGYCVVS